ncbi:hypothetical protein [uncultured Parasphingorhabdus sp.]|uniref:hypothetical protein n=1 Tax=uncultured Parasphingorhabdus sp. TaxID=2709694 RepID=UPI002AA60B22|nr:hypothetical protein [uncultured Parasphingorhabdus sp.]
MARYLDAAGNPVPAHIAKINGMLKPGYREVMVEGEYARLDIMTCDAASSTKESSIDERLRAAIQLKSEQSNQSYTDWLANARFEELEKLAHSVVTSALREAGGQGVAAMFSNDTGNADLNDALRRALSDHHNKAAVESIRDYRYSHSASTMPGAGRAEIDPVSAGEFRDTVRNNRYSS